MWNKKAHTHFSLNLFKMFFITLPFCWLHTTEHISEPSASLYPETISPGIWTNCLLSLETHGSSGTSPFLQTLFKLPLISQCLCFSVSGISAFLSPRRTKNTACYLSPVQQNQKLLPESFQSAEKERQGGARYLQTWIYPALCWEEKGKLISWNSIS